MCRSSPSSAINTSTRSRRSRTRSTSPVEGITTVEGRPGREFMVIIEGEATVRRGGQEINRRLGAGDFFGEIALLEDRPERRR